MAIPKYQELMLPVLELIRDGRETIPDCIGPLVKRFRLSAEEKEELLPSGKQTVLSNRAHWARNYMSQAGLVEAIKRGHYRITPRGESFLDQGKTEITVKDLEQFEEFLEFKNRSRNDSDLGESNEAARTSDETPEDRILDAVAEIKQSLSRELLSAVLSLSPSRFEQLIVDLLISMGYGGGNTNMGRKIGQSGDGGIDGIINEDPLGLDAVYIQAKRYDPSNNVGRPALQAFVGSLTGESATQGVLVTTSGFSREAKDYVSRVQQRIVLIDGERLASLMMEHGVGVRARSSFSVLRLDEDYFSEE